MSNELLFDPTRGKRKIGRDFLVLALKIRVDKTKLNKNDISHHKNPPACHIERTRKGREKSK